MPEVPQNMQEDLQRMELEAREPRNTTAAPTKSAASPPGQHGREPSLPKSTAAPAQQQQQQQQQQPSQQQQPPPSGSDFRPFKDSNTTYQNMPSHFEGPNFSPFPRVKGDNIPPSDEEKEEILYNAREHVLHSNNVSMQLSWARDALNWVEIAAEAHMRENNGQTTRSQTPKVEHQLRADAVQIVEYLCQQNHPEALFMKAKWIEFGKFGYRLDLKEAYLGYKKAAEQAYGRAEYRMGMLFENTNDIQKALEHYNLGLSYKDSAASYRLGMMNLTGQHGQRKDFQRGLELIQTAADSADEDAPQGAYVYGMLIARDLPDINIPEGMLPYNVNVARQYIEKAAYLGFSKAQLKMGQAYELCQLGCDFNPACSLHYYGLASRQGQPEAALGVSRWFLFGYEGVFQKNEQLAFKYAKTAGESGLPTGEFAMGYYFEIGIHVQKNLREARAWYEKASEHGNSDAKGRLSGLDQSKTLTKADHETTVLTRIKSQHGSQRGQRPERFKQKESPLPTLSESGPATPVEGPTAALPLKGAASPRQSPRQKPTIVGDQYDMPDHSRHSSMGNRPPAFTVNLDQNLAVRPKSVAPYPEDDRPPPLHLNRPKSVAPYPDDDVNGGRPPLSPHYNPQIRPSAGPQADRPMSAFGIRPQNQNTLHQSQSTSNLVPPAGTQPPRGRLASAGWEPQLPAGGGGYRQPSPGPGGYRQPSPGPGRNDFPPQRLPYDAGPQPGRQSVGPGPPPVSGPVDPMRNRLTKNNPHPGQFSMSNSSSQHLPPQQPGYGMSGGGGGGGGGQPGRDYGQRTSSRPMSDVYSGGGRVDSLPSQVGHSRLPSAGGVAGRPLKDRPAAMDAMAGRQSAPPLQHAQHPPQQRPSPANSMPNFHSPSPQQQPPSRPGSVHPSAAPQKPMSGQGPATFEAMGIPQGKNDSDCVSTMVSRRGGGRGFADAMQVVM